MTTVADDQCIPVHGADDITTGPARWRSTRFILCYLACVGMCVVYIQRVSLSLAIVCMVNHTALHVHKSNQDMEFSDSNGTSNTSSYNISRVTDGYSVEASNDSSRLTSTTRQPEYLSCQLDEDQSIPNREEDGPFAWDKETQGLLLSAVYVTYSLMQIPGSYVIRRLGARVTVGVSVLAMSVCHVLCHPAALLSPWAVLALRTLMGVCTALTMPAIYGMWTRWAPKAEQSQLLGIAFSGQMIANAFAYPLSALLCRYGFLGGWPSVFYAFGGFGALWSVVWFLMMTDSPESHPRISASERHFIVSTRADVIYHKDRNGLYSMMPYLALFLVTSSGGFLTDVIIKRGWLSVVRVRKMMTTLPLCTAAVLLVVMSHLDCDHAVTVVVLLTVAVGVSGLALTGGFFINPYDVAPHFAVSICTVTNTVACVGGFLNPYLVAAITVNQTREEWQVVFYLTGGMYVAGCVLFCVLARGHVQPWALPHPILHSIEGDTAEPLSSNRSFKNDRTQMESLKA